MHIHPSFPDSVSPTSSQSEENAAIKIQAGFRGYCVRKQLHHQTRCAINDYHPRRSASHRRHHRQRHIQVMHNQDPAIASGNSAPAQLRDDHNSGSEAASLEDQCATKIQAGVRGFLVRKKQKLASEAATKIQAGFRGFKVRKEAQKLKQN